MWNQIAQRNAKHNTYFLFDLHHAMYYFHSFHSIKYHFTKTNSYTSVHLFSCPREVNTILQKMKTKLLDFPLLLANSLFLSLYFSIFPSHCSRPYSHFCSACPAASQSFHSGFRKKALKAAALVAGVQYALSTPSAKAIKTQAVLCE